MLIRHPMETGLRKDKKTGKPVPAHFIKEVTCQHKSQTVFQALWGIAISKNPFLSFTLKDVKKGDELSIRWVDNKGASDNTVVTL
jgi:sulfur-oxidizing protein SoxZ